MTIVRTCEDIMVNFDLVTDFYIYGDPFETSAELRASTRIETFTIYTWDLMPGDDNTDFNIKVINKLKKQQLEHFANAISNMKPGDVLDANTFFKIY